MIQSLYCLLLGVFCCTAWANSTQKIVVIDSYHHTYPWVESYRLGLGAKLNNYQLHYFEMDTKRISPEHFQARADLAWQFFLDHDPELLIIADDNALKLLAERTKQQSKPVVYLGINQNPRYYSVQSSAHITGVLERPLLKRNIATIRRLIPKDKLNVLVLFDNGNTSKAILLEEFLGQRDNVYAGVETHIKLIDDWSQWQQEILQIDQQGYDAVIIGTYHTVYDSEVHVPSEQVLEWSVKHLSVPSFGFWDFSVGVGKTMGGLVLFGYEQGRIAGELALKILEEGKTPSHIGPVTAEKGRYIFSRSGLAAFQLHLPESLKEKALLVE